MKTETANKLDIQFFSKQLQSQSGGQELKTSNHGIRETGFGVGGHESRSCNSVHTHTALRKKK